MHQTTWSKSEKTIARAAFEKAYRRECENLVTTVRASAQAVAGPEDVWRLHDQLTKRRKEIDDKYDYRYSVLVFIFARLIGDGLIDCRDLQGLSQEKVEQIRFLVHG